MNGHASLLTMLVGYGLCIAMLGLATFVVVGVGWCLLTDPTGAHPFSRITER